MDQMEEQDKLKTVQVVEQLVAPFVGTHHRTIYVDHFYTSVELLRSLRERDLYVTGTMLANRIPLTIQIPKTSPTTFQNMARGDAFKCRLQFQLANGGMSHPGLVCRLDRNMVIVCQMTLITILNLRSAAAGMEKSFRLSNGWCRP